MLRHILSDSGGGVEENAPFAICDKWWFYQMQFIKWIQWQRTYFPTKENLTRDYWVLTRECKPWSKMRDQGLWTMDRGLGSTSFVSGSSHVQFEIYLLLKVTKYQSIYTRWWEMRKTFRNHQLNSMKKSHKYTSLYMTKTVLSNTWHRHYWTYAGVYQPRYRY